MPDKEFLEETPLYKKCELSESMRTLQAIPKVAINMHCAHCASNQTFVMTNTYWEPNEGAHTLTGERILRLRYECSHCDQSTRQFFVLVNSDQRTLEKVGQYPPWDISGNKDIERRLGATRSFIGED
jgi:hypothetical protein